MTTYILDQTYQWWTNGAQVPAGTLVGTGTPYPLTPDFKSAPPGWTAVDVSGWQALQGKKNQPLTGPLSQSTS